MKVILKEIIDDVGDKYTVFTTTKAYSTEKIANYYFDCYKCKNSSWCENNYCNNSHWLCVNGHNRKDKIYCEHFEV